MNPINLLDLLDAQTNLSEQELKDYLYHYGINIHFENNPERGVKGLRLYEINSICSFARHICGKDCVSAYDLMEGFYLGFESDSQTMHSHL